MRTHGRFQMGDPELARNLGYTVAKSSSAVCQSPLFLPLGVGGLLPVCQEYVKCALIVTGLTAKPLP